MSVICKRTITYSPQGMVETADFDGKLVAAEKNIRGTNFIEARNDIEGWCCL